MGSTQETVFQFLVGFCQADGAAPLGDSEELSIPCWILLGLGPGAAAGKTPSFNSLLDSAMAQRLQELKALQAFQFLVEFCCVQGEAAHSVAWRPFNSLLDFARLTVQRYAKYAAMAFNSLLDFAWTPWGHLHVFLIFQFLVGFCALKIFAV